MQPTSLRCVNSVIMAPSPPSSEIMPKHDEYLGGIGNKYISRQQIDKVSAHRFNKANKKKG